ncbi:TonB-linked SusC/RagA family outer membrane protein [Breznakibacter xylanolyticus]|uniref:TonB-linked SusC/RagA family outer membrane protein n=1 Tax=Breznakibacter xylanolyticus TaxID=990 RepID=A0A2W7P9V8_9BACT|nr:TonB-dependent receptor [Breznakibacter xylanolyticus]PZX20142.1 TonB-linked SusC/RagA family outer membrane protein [Breznakibacter xylanolyticus]
MRQLIKQCFAVLGFMMFGVLAMAQQTQTVKGKVLDATGAPIPGANVMIQGTTTGTITDMDGNYVLEVPDAQNAVLVFSFIGFQNQTVPVSNKTTINSVLKDDTIGLDEVVAIGYGVVKKRDLTGAVSSVKSDDITKTASSNAMSSMQARVPGIDIQQASGEAGSKLNINLRGNRSISASNDPLILVDGVEYGSTLDLNPSDIESMEVLKDASSTAIYGTKGANGVIIITTKRGKAGKTVVTVNSYLSSNQPTHVPQVMYGLTEVNRRINAERYKRDAILVKAGTGNWGDTKFDAVPVTDVLGGSAVNNLPYSEMDIYNEGSYTNWADQILQNGLTQNYEVSVSGGSESTNFNLSVGAMFEEGLLRNDKLDRYNVKSNIDHKMGKAFKVGTSLLYTYKSHDKRTNVFGQALKMTSIAHPYDESGNIILKPSPTYEAHANPLLDEVDGNFQHNVETPRFFGNGYLEIIPVKNLFFKSMIALDRMEMRDGLYQDFQSVGKLQAATGSYISVENQTQTKYTWENTLNYTTDLGTINHSLTGLLGHSMIQDVLESRTISGNTAAEHFYESSFYDLNNIKTPVLDKEYVKKSMLSYFMRLNYKFMDKYLLTASLRADGSSVLAKGKKWGYFPSVAAAWRVNEESFLTDIVWLDNLKLRTSWGISGNAAVNPYETVTTLSDFPVYYNLDGVEYAGKIPSKYGNDQLTWEKTSSLNFGLDFGVWSNRLSGSVDVYFSNTYDLLYYKSIPASQTYPQILDNIGETKASGVEIALNTLILNNTDFKWDINWSASFSQDEITKLSGGLTKNINGTIGQVVGEPVNIYYNYEADGCWGIGEFDTYKAAWLERHPGETMAMTGDPGTIKIIDANDNGKIDDDDKKVYNRSPKAVVGMNNTFTYKNLSLSVLVYARLGGYIAYDFNGLVTYDSSNWGDVDYWTPENQGAKFPTPGVNTNWSTYGGAALYEDASYLKVKDITLAYNLPQSLISKVGIGRVKVYGSVKNYFTFSNIDNYDPERGGAITFPLAKQLVCGINVEF